WRGLTLLGALDTQRARQQLSGMVVASVVVTGLLLTLWNGPALLGIAIPLGAVGGMFLHLGLGLLPGGPQRLVVRQDDRPAERSILLIAVIGAVLAHLIEI